jgi:hypothetical protein
MIRSADNSREEKCEEHIFLELSEVVSEEIENHAAGGLQDKQLDDPWRPSGEGTRGAVSKVRGSASTGGLSRGFGRAQNAKQKAIGRHDRSGCLARGCKHRGDVFDPVLGSEND